MLFLWRPFVPPSPGREIVSCNLLTLCDIFILQCSSVGLGKVQTDVDLALTMVCPRPKLVTHILARVPEPARMLVYLRGAEYIGYNVLVHRLGDCMGDLLPTHVPTQVVVSKQSAIPASQPRGRLDRGGGACYRGGNPDSYMELIPS
jgi:hypothetical protein